MLCGYLHSLLIVTTDILLVVSLEAYTLHAFTILSLGLHASQVLLMWVCSIVVALVVVYSCDGMNKGMMLFSVERCSSALVARALLLTSF